MNFVKLTQVDSRASRIRYADELEDDGHGSAVEATRSVLVNVQHVRSLTARRNGPGTRITFADGGGFSVTEALEEVSRMVNIRLI